MFDLDSLVGSRIKMEREKQGLTQAQLAARVGTGSRTYQRWEAGERLDLVVLQKISSALGVSVASLVEVTPDSRPEVVSEESPPYTAAPSTVEQLTGIVATLTRLVETSQEQQARLLDHQDKLLARIEQAQAQLDRSLDYRDELAKVQAENAKVQAENTRLRGELLAAGAPDSSAVRKLAR